jgi:hypothetical protein
MGWNLYGVVEYRTTEKSNIWQMFGKFDFGRNTDIQIQRTSIGTTGIPDDISRDLLWNESLEVLEQTRPNDINKFVYSDVAEKAVETGRAFWFDKQTKSRLIYNFTSPSWATSHDLELLLTKLDDWISQQKITSVIAFMKVLSSDNDNLCRIIFWIQ